MSQKESTYYVTTPIYYANSDLHIGHAYATVAADVLARFNRFRGRKTFFLTGTDEHGQKIEEKARAAGKEPGEFVDEVVAGIVRLWERLGITYDDFIRTTEPRHTRVVQGIFGRLLEQGDIYKSHYEGWYCTPCETFWLERQLADGKCPNPDCGREVKLLKEESYFFRLSNYQDRLLEHIRSNPDFIQPPSRRNEMISFIQQGLEDLCVTRTTFDWGIPVPFDPGHVVYVWVDALTNYISAIGYLSGDPEREKLFRTFWPADLHLVGKEIMRFHTIIWPVLLMALDLPLPHKVFGHGWMVLDRGKMSKSKGNVIDPHVLMDRYGVDSVRYFLLREIPFGADGRYSEAALIERTNVDLANDLGNLLNRTLTMLEKYRDGVVPAPVAEVDDGALEGLLADVASRVEKAMEALQIPTALETIWELVSLGNHYIEDNAPWNLAKNPGEAARLDTVLYNLLETLRAVGGLLVPFLPDAPGRIWDQLGLAGDPGGLGWDGVTRWGGLPPGTKARKGQPLFPRIDTKGRGAGG
jgi:methionyl-tRNA synthetase